MHFYARLLQLLLTQVSALAVLLVALPSLSYTIFLKFVLESPGSVSDPHGHRGEETKTETKL